MINKRLKRMSTKLLNRCVGHDGPAMIGLNFKIVWVQDLNVFRVLLTNCFFGSP